MMVSMWVMVVVMVVVVGDQSGSPVCAGVCHL